MVCPKCEEGVLKTIQFKKSEKRAILCEYCGNVWFDKEEVFVNAGHAIQSLTKNGDNEYSFIDAAGNEEETKPVVYPVYK